MGGNFYGQLGDGAGSSRITPMQIEISGVSAMAAGESHSLYLKTDGSLWAMGWNMHGQLGDGTTTDRSTPAQIESSGVSAIAAGKLHSLYLKTDGSLWAMGDNYYGQLGDGTITDRVTPVQIESSGVSAIAAGGLHSLYLKSDGSLWAMGRNYHGQLGDGTTTGRYTPVQIEISGVSAMAGGRQHSLYLKSDGSLWATGDNNYGQLGDGTTTDRNTPVQIESSGVSVMAAGGSHSLYLKSDGSLWAMGLNISGQLGDGTITDRVTPVQLESSGVSAIATGEFHSLYLKSDGSLWVMGENISGQLGDGTTTDRSTPVQIESSGVSAMAGGSSHSLYLKAGYMIVDTPLIFSSISSPQTMDVPFSVTITGSAGTSGVARLWSSAGSVEPTKVNLVDGVWSGQVKMLDQGANLVLHASLGGSQGSSNSFEVQGPHGATGVLMGRVYDSSGAAMSGVTVRISENDDPDTWDYETTTDTQGGYKFNNLPQSIYYVWASDGSRNSLFLERFIRAGIPTLAGLQFSSQGEEGKYPVLLVPGILGSETQGNIWPVPELPRDYSPEFNDGKLQLVDGMLSDLKWRELKSLLEAAGHAVYEVPYDWRKKNDWTALNILKPWIDQAKNETAQPKVHIVAHSMGGLVARAYIQSQYYEGDVDKLLMAGTPSNGSATAYRLWESGRHQTWVQKRALTKLNPAASLGARALYNKLRKTVGAPLALVISQDYHDSCQRNYIHDQIPSLRELVPTYYFLDRTSDSVPDSFPTCDGYPNVWLNSLNDDTGSLDMFTTGDSSDTTRVRTLVIKGTNVRTLVGFQVSDSECARAFYPDGEPTREIYGTSGDETVLAFSTEFPANVSHEYSEGSEHTKLIADNLGRIVEFITGQAPENVYRAGSSSLSGTLSTPSPRLTVQISGRIQGYLTSPGGQVSGIQNQAVVTDIPSSQVTADGEICAISIEDPADGAYTLHLNGQYQEDFSIFASYGSGESMQSLAESAFNHGSPLSYSLNLDAAAANPLAFSHAPSAPEGLQAQPSGSLGSEVVRLEWQASDDPQVTGYLVYSREDTQPYYSALTQTSSNSHATADAWVDGAGGTIRQYVVSAAYADGTESFLSLPVLNNDRDGDGMSDYDEAIAGSSPTDPDSDDDGLGDLGERLRGADPWAPDTDGDGYKDGFEAAAGSDPLDPTSIPAINNAPLLMLIAD